VEAVIASVCDDLLGSQHDLVTVELYVAAARNPALKAVTQAWMRRSRKALERHFDPTTAREVDALRRTGSAQRAVHRTHDHRPDPPHHRALPALTGQHPTVAHTGLR